MITFGGATFQEEGNMNRRKYMFISSMQVDIT